MDRLTKVDIDSITGIAELPMKTPYFLMNENVLRTNCRKFLSTFRTYCYEKDGNLLNKDEF